MGLKNEFETAVVNEPSVFEPMKFYYIRRRSHCFLRNALSYSHTSNNSNATKFYIFVEALWQILGINTILQ